MAIEYGEVGNRSGSDKETYSSVSIAAGKNPMKSYYSNSRYSMFHLDGNRQ
jgi:hypothetical protein